MVWNTDSENIVELPDGRQLSVAAGIDAEEARKRIIAQYPELFNVQPEEDPSGFFPGLFSSWENYKGAVSAAPAATAAGSEFLGGSRESREGLLESAKQTYQEYGERASEILPDPASPESIGEAYEEEGLWGATGETFDFIKQSIGQQVPIFGAFGVGQKIGSTKFVQSTVGRAGTALASRLIPAAAAPFLPAAFSNPWTGTAAGLAVAAALAYTTMLQDNAEKAEDVDDIKPLRVAAYAAPHAALNYISFVMTGALGPLKQRLAADTLKATLAGASTKTGRSAWKAAGKQGAESLSEFPTELAQTVIERAQRGDSISLDDANFVTELIETAAATAPVVGAFGGYGSYRAYRKEKADIAKFESDTEQEKAIRESKAEERRKIMDQDEARSLRIQKENEERFKRASGDYESMNERIAEEALAMAGREPVQLSDVIEVFDSRGIDSSSQGAKAFILRNTDGVIKSLHGLKDNKNLSNAERTKRARYRRRIHSILSGMRSYQYEGTTDALNLNMFTQAQFNQVIEAVKKSRLKRIGPDNIRQILGMGNSKIEQSIASKILKAMDQRGYATRVTQKDKTRPYEVRDPGYNEAQYDEILRQGRESGRITQEMYEKVTGNYGKEKYDLFISDMRNRRDIPEVDARPGVIVPVLNNVGIGQVDVGVESESGYFIRDGDRIVGGATNLNEAKELLKRMRKRSISYSVVRNGEVVKTLKNSSEAQAYLDDSKERDPDASWEKRTNPAADLKLDKSKSRGLRVVERFYDENDNLTDVYEDSFVPDEQTAAHRVDARRKEYEAAPTAWDKRSGKTQKKAIERLTEQLQGRGLLNKPRREDFQTRDTRRTLDTREENTQRENMVLDSIRTALDRVGLTGIAAAIDQRIGDQTGEAFAAFDASRRAISVALDKIQGAETQAEIDEAIANAVSHELIHALRELDLFTAGEWLAISRAVARVRVGEGQRQKYREAVAKLKRENPDLSDFPDAELAPNATYWDWATAFYGQDIGGMTPQQANDYLLEEAVAQMYADYITDPYVNDQITGQTKGLLDRIKLFLERLYNSISGLGYGDAGDVFAAIGKGSIGTRKEEIRTIRSFGVLGEETDASRQAREETRSPDYVPIAEDNEKAAEQLIDEEEKETPEETQQRLQRGSLPIPRTLIPSLVRDIDRRYPSYDSGDNLKRIDPSPSRIEESILFSVEDSNGNKIPYELVLEFGINTASPRALASMNKDLSMKLGTPVLDNVKFPDQNIGIIDFSFKTREMNHGFERVNRTTAYQYDALNYPANSGISVAKQLMTTAQNVMNEIVTKVRPLSLKFTAADSVRGGFISSRQRMYERSATKAAQLGGYDLVLITHSLATEPDWFDGDPAKIVKSFDWDSKPSKGQITYSETFFHLIKSEESEVVIQNELDVDTAFMGERKDLEKLNKFPEKVERKPNLFLEKNIDKISPTIDPDFRFQRDDLSKAPRAIDEKEVKGNLNFDQRKVLEMMRGQMYDEPLPEVVTKELLQNSWDAVKSAESLGIIAPGEGKIEIRIDRDELTISFSDNGVGMNPQILQDAFFTIGGTLKEGLEPGESAGGFGWAKAAFLLDSESISVDTVKDGVRSRVQATSEEIMNSNFVIKTSETNLPNGTTVVVKFPESFIDQRTRESKSTYIPYVPNVLEKPLVGDVEVTLLVKHITDDYENQEIPLVGNSFLDGGEFNKFTTVDFDWGSADIYVATERDTWAKQMVLSSGVYQFNLRSHDWKAEKDLREALPHNVVIDIHPSVPAIDPSYPFRTDRENFKGYIKKDIDALVSHLLSYGRAVEAEQTAKVFDSTIVMERISIDELAEGADLEIQPTRWIPREAREISREDLETTPEIPEINRRVEIRDGEIETGGLTFSPREEISEVVASSEPLDFDTSSPLFHNNTNLSIPAEAQTMLSEIGSIVIEFRDLVSEIRGYEKLTAEGVLYATGISIDKSYQGVHVKAPFKAFFLNPLDNVANNLEGVAGAWWHTLAHEAAHTNRMSHDESFTSELGNVLVKLSDMGYEKPIRSAMTNVLKRNWETYINLRREYGKSNVQNLGKSLEDQGGEAQRSSREASEGLYGGISSAGGPDYGNEGRATRGVERGPESDRKFQRQGIERTALRASPFYGDEFANQIFNETPGFIPRISTRPARDLNVRPAIEDREALTERQRKIARGEIEGLKFSRSDINQLNNSRRSRPLPPDIQKIQNRVSPEVKDKSFFDYIKMLWDSVERTKFFTKLRQDYIDKYESISKLARRANDLRKMNRQDQLLLADVNSASAAYLSDKAIGIVSESVTSGQPVYRDGRTYVDYEKQGLFQILKDVYQGGHIHLWHTWMIHRRENRFEKDRGFVVGSTSEERTKIDNYVRENGLLELFERTNTEYQKWNENLVEFMKDTGIVDSELGEVFKSFGDYIPFYRVFEGEASKIQQEEMAKLMGQSVQSLRNTINPETGQPYLPAPVAQSPSPIPNSMFGSLTGAKPPKAAKGGSGLIVDPLEAMMMNLQAAVTSGMKNVAAQRVMRDAEYVSQNARPGEEILVTRVKSGEGNKTIRVNGKEVEFLVHDQLLFDSLSGMMEGRIGWMSLFSGPSTVLREMVTRSPDFIMANLLRDSVSTWVASGTNMKPFLGTFNQFFKGGIAGRGQVSDAMKQLVGAGIVGGYDYGIGTKGAKKLFAERMRQSGMTVGANKGNAVITPIKKIWDWAGDVTTKSDAATRAAVYEDVYKTLINRGHSVKEAEAEAIFQAGEILNFSRRGRSGLARFITTAIPFLNARVQGLDLLYRAGRSQYSADYSKIGAKRNLISMLTRGAMLASVTGMYAMLVHDDEEWKSASEQEKDDYFILPSFGGMPSIRIPIPFEVGVIFKVMPERFMRNFLAGDTELAQLTGLSTPEEGYADNRQTADSIKRAIISTFEINPFEIQATKPILEVMMNHSFFTGRPIIPPYMTDDALLPERQKRPNTAALAVAIADLYGGSPMKVEHLLRGYTGTVGTWVTMALDDSIRTMKGMPAKAELRTDQWPLIRRFLQSDLGASGQLNDFYMFREDVRRIVNSINDLKRTDRDIKGAREMAQENKDIMRVKGMVDNMDKRLKAIRQAQQRVYLSDMSPEEKLKQMNRFDQMRKQALQRMPELRKMANLPYFEG
jgi:hypothetical protein